ncbi:hypothetical protein SCAB_64731 [Streptomyces scabiei 87.22]|uniref:Uncharacterized protein n=1 Tax=Streptomyces scabiei (strain 87.22) TaxID=680198 RepID=C9ZE44_STRSW|nr:hypothetical protein [Streptomyces scabiei]MDX3052937.1 hypothetical protein [Streptomyces scabiei]MDX3078722.1 hypothetical protein [Streptomyces scabiei]MDX3177552.1 hypothetical protein [Streptomyces scabiei]MDX3271207.1 hypothetical protein [Streptomyces scabiei]MDX3394935.1 hypothetical protein [Streptomyces scabiei]
MSDQVRHVPGQIELLPDDPPRYGGPAAVPATPITTSGRTEFTVRCESGCGEYHRHTGPGVRTTPCGATYTVPALTGPQESPP